MNRIFIKTISFFTSTILLACVLKVNAEIIPLYGDINGDENVDVTDLTILSLYLLGDIKLDSDQKVLADCDANNDINLADLALLKQFILKDDVKLGKNHEDSIIHSELMMNGVPDDEYIEKNNITVVGDGSNRMTTVVMPFHSENELSEYLGNLGDNKYYSQADKEQIDKAFDEYDKDFFDKNTLLVFTAYMPDDFTLNVDKIYITKENINVYISGKNISNISLCSLYSWVIKVEVPNEKYNNQSADCILDSDSLMYKKF
jgi:hypothetical protein